LSTGYKTVFSFSGNERQQTRRGAYRHERPSVWHHHLWGKYASGTVFSLSASGTESVLHNFEGYPKDGGSPNGLAVLEGTLCGTTFDGGKSVHWVQLHRRVRNDF
jgi:hypothetical protein